jgi:hypothetical protein
MSSLVHLNITVFSPRFGLDDRHGNDAIARCCLSVALSMSMIIDPMDEIRSAIVGLILRGKETKSTFPA